MRFIGPTRFTRITHNTHTARTCTRARLNMVGRRVSIYKMRTLYLWPHSPPATTAVRSGQKTTPPLHYPHRHSTHHHHTPQCGPEFRYIVSYIIIISETRKVFKLVDIFEYNIILYIMRFLFLWVFRFCYTHPGRRHEKFCGPLRSHPVAVAVKTLSHITRANSLNAISARHQIRCNHRHPPQSRIILSTSDPTI